MYKNRFQGFTLIELLVVIAIIGILSAVVLASLSTARSKGSDAAIQSDLGTIRTQAEIFYGNNGNSYAGTATVNDNSCTTTGSLFADPTIAKAITGADAASPAANSVTCNSSATAYAVQAALVAGINVGGTNYLYWCVDNKGTAKPEAAAMDAGVTACL